MSFPDFNSAQEEELAYWLAFNMLSGTGLGFRKIKLLYDHFQGLQGAWQAPLKELGSLPWLNPTIIERFSEQKSLCNPCYCLKSLKPAVLRHCHIFTPTTLMPCGKFTIHPCFYSSRGSFIFATSVMP